ncbi:hypothetical protein JHK86_007215 [Glycine max]|nr:hypothetical protein JHK86_007215 [Glycine max]
MAMKEHRPPQQCHCLRYKKNPSSTLGGKNVWEKKIRVMVQTRPLNRKEQAMHDLIVWDCLDEHTIVFKNPNQEKPATPLIKFLHLHA